MKKLLLIAVCVFSAFNILGQVYLGGQVNEYFIVGTINADRIDIKDPDDISGVINPGDIVMLIQMTGHTIGTSGGWQNSNGNLSNIRNTGKYEFLRVESVITAADTTVVFTANLLNSYNAGERIQLVKVVEVDYGIVNSEITAMDWNGQKGGIIAIVANQKLTLNSNINVSNKGFLGGQPYSNYTGGCRTTPDAYYFLTSEVNVAGNKGQGILTTAAPVSEYKKGRGHYGNGGGGGNGKFSGGGGGSNFGYGGSGGNQIQSCAPVSINARGGEAFGPRDIYEVFDKRVIMGGGGGSSTENTDTLATSGGDGGGIVFIIADTLESNSMYIYANGASVGGTALAGAGGGGGGGTVCLDVTTYEGTLTVQVRGGQGGNTGGYCAGPGGGGGGGAVWYSGFQLTASTVVTGGNAGTGCLTNTAFQGSNGAVADSLITQVNGFMFNYISGIDSICEGDRPDTIIASLPKGGDGIYTYDWESSTDQLNWFSATGDKELRFFRPEVLSQTTYYRRWVTSGGLSDTSKIIEIFVYPEISNNILTLRDTICYLESPGLLSANSVAGGDGSYTYRWESSTNGAIWNYRGDQENFNESNSLSQSVIYKRTVYSAGLCISISENDTITVFSAVSNNNITEGHALCGPGLPDSFSGSLPGAGDDIYTFEWQYLEQGETVWEPAPGANNNRDYTSGAISVTTQFRRKASYNLCPEISGNSNIITVTVYSPIGNNTIDNNIPFFVCYNSPARLNGSSNLTGGNGTYDYIWEYSENSIVWEAGISPNNQEDFLSGDIIDTSYFRRIVASGDFDECIDTSDIAEAFIHLLPAGDIIDDIDTICAGEAVHADYYVSGNGPWNITIGDGDLSTTQQVTNTTGSMNITLNTDANIQMISIEDANGCFADISGNTGIVEVKVYEVPTANAGTYAGVCGLSIDLNAVPSVGDGLWTGPFVTISDVADPGALIEVPNYGEYVFTWTETNWECFTDNEVLITFYEQPDYAYSGEDTTLEYTFSTKINALAPVIGQGTWSAESGSVVFGNPDTESTIVEFNDIGKYILFWTVENGVCVPVIDSLIITITDLIVEKGFSPNDDGHNDFFKIELGDAQNAELAIFNRWGKIVYENKNYVEGDFWDGKSLNGNDLPEDTYFYIFKFDNGRIIKSFVELRR